MIVFELICPLHHRFEGWFGSPEDFDSQKAGGMLSCPTCGDSAIEKILTAKIRIAEAASQASVPENQAPVPTRPANLSELIDFVLTNTENVGGEFPDEARRIHYKQAPHRNIRGTATHQQTEDLLEEGIPVMPLPIPPQGEWH